MNALILAAGYATRLYPLTLNKAKPLLVVGGKPIIEWVVDNLQDVPDLETIYVVTNDKFAGDFQAWSEGYQDRHPRFKFKIVNDDDGIITHLEEKPRKPRGTLAAIALY